MKHTERAFKSVDLHPRAPAQSRRPQLSGWHAGLLAAAILGLAAVMFFCRLGSRSLWASEGRWAEVAREMSLTGNYFWPTINGRVYYDKPLLSYWLVVGSGKLLHETDEAAARLPSACAGLTAVALTLLIARRLYDDQVALSAAFVLATSFSFVFFSRHASADMETVAGELAALALFLKTRVQPVPGWLALFWLTMALTSLTKGLLGFVLPLLIAFTYSCLAEGWRELFAELAKAPATSWPLIVARRNRWLFNRYSLFAAALAAAVYLMPFILSYFKTGSNLGLYMVFRENVLRFVHPFDHRGPLLLYVPVIFALMAPWSALLPGALICVHHIVRSSGPSPCRAGDRFALTFFWVTFIFFTAAGSRRSYYLLPILPAGALLIARTLTLQRQSMPQLGRWTLVAGYFIIASSTLLGIVALAPSSFLPGRLAHLPPLPHPYVFTLMWIAASAGVVYALAKARSRAWFIAACLSAYLGLAYVFIVAMPAVERYRGERIFARAVVARLNGAPETLAMYKIWGPGLTFYLRSPRPIPEFDDAGALSAYIADGRVRWIITRVQDLGAVRSPFVIVEREPSFPWEPEERGRSKYLLLRIERN
jgi:4-amino-4-deoxy-L-arabinose transferase-like glycosyltransferase